MCSLKWIYISILRNIEATSIFDWFINTFIDIEATIWNCHILMYFLYSEISVYFWIYYYIEGVKLIFVIKTSSNIVYNKLILPKVDLNGKIFSNLKISTKNIEIQKVNFRASIWLLLIYFEKFIKYSYWRLNWDSNLPKNVLFEYRMQKLWSIKVYTTLVDVSSKCITLLKRHLFLDTIFRLVWMLIG